MSPAVFFAAHRCKSKICRCWLQIRITIFSLRTGIPKVSCCAANYRRIDGISGFKRNPFGGTGTVWFSFLELPLKRQFQTSLVVRKLTSNKELCKYTRIFASVSFIYLGVLLRDFKLFTKPSRCPAIGFFISCSAVWISPLFTRSTKTRFQTTLKVTWRRFNRQRVFVTLFV